MLLQRKGESEMKILISKTGIIEEQIVDIDNDVTIIYGYNNSGKTTILKAINDVISKTVMEGFVRGKDEELSLYMPTDRVVLRERLIDNKRLNDVEDYLNYQKEALEDFSLHLKKVRDNLMSYEMIRKYINSAISKIFGIEIENNEIRLSDGVENIINIYTNIIWAMTWNLDLNNLIESDLHGIFSNKSIYVMIDEIEMFLHVNVQSKLIKSLKNDFASCRFVFTTHSPLLLTRYKNAKVYNIINGVLYHVNEEMYYEDLDCVYESCFDVEELPQEVKDEIIYLGDIALKKEKPDIKKINDIAENWKKNYPNIFRRNNKFIVKALSMGE